jgi:hypothetical protein
MLTEDSVLARSWMQRRASNFLTALALSNDAAPTHWKAIGDPTKWPHDVAIERL